MRDVSDLEREYELETEGAGGDIEREFEALRDETDDREVDDQEASEDRESFDREDDDREADPRSFGERFYELSRRQYESEWELDQELRDVLGEMERKYFFGSLLKKARGAASKLARKGARFALDKVKRLPAFQAVSGMTQLLRGNLGDAMLRMAKAGLMSAVPGASVALPALQALGFGGDRDREAWGRFDEFAREAYEHAADMVHEEVDDPAAASQIANEAVQMALRQVYRHPGVRIRTHARDDSGARQPRDHRELVLRPGQTLVIRGG